MSAKTKRPQKRPSYSTAHQWQAAATEWAQHLESQGRAATTIAGYLKHVSWLAGDLAPTCPDPFELPGHDLADWLDRQHWSAVTRGRVIVSLRSFYTWAVMHGHARRSPLSGINVPPPKVRGPQRSPVPDAWTRPLADYLTFQRSAGRSPLTIDRRREHVSRFAQHHADPFTITAADLIRWLSRTDWSPAYKRGVRASLRSFYTWAHRFGHMPYDPSADLDPVRVRRTLPRPAPDDAVHIAMSRATDRTRLALALGLYAGLRRAEIAGLHTRDIGTDTLRIYGKGGHERIVPLHPELAAMLRAELNRRREGTTTPTGWGPHCPAPDGWLFPSDDPDTHLTPRWMGTLIGQAMPPGWTAHTLRHRFATQAYRGTHDLRAVQELLGHSKPEVTARYAAVDPAALTAAVMAITNAPDPSNVKP